MSSAPVRRKPGPRSRTMKSKSDPVRPECLICRSKFQYRSLPSDATVKSLVNQFEIFCHYMSLNVKKANELDFFQEPFPFCQNCKEILNEMEDLHEQILKLQEAISVHVSTLSAKVIQPKNADKISKAPSKEDLNSFSVSESTLKKVESLRKELHNQFNPYIQLSKCPATWKRKKPCPRRFKSTAEGQLDTVTAPQQLLTVSPSKNIEVVQVQAISIGEIDVHGSDDGPTFDFMDAMDVGDGDQRAHANEGQIVYQLIVPNEGEEIVIQEGAGESLQVFEEQLLEGMELTVGEEVVYQEPTNHWNIVRARKRDPDAPLMRSREIEPNKFIYGNEKYPFEKVNEVFKCGSCDVEKDTKAKIMRHIALKHVYAGRYCCEFCGKTFPTEDYLSKHKLSHPELSATGPVICDMCGKKFNSRQHMIYRHKCPMRDFKLESTDEIVHPCDLCDASFRYNSLLQDHINKCHLNPVLKCFTCGKTFPSPEELKTHKIIHLKVNPYLCDYCTESFNSKLQLQGHVIMNHKGFGRKHKRDVEASTSGDRPFQCSICQASFKKPVNLTAHFKSVHGDERPHKCDRCDGAFKSKSGLRCHIRSVHEKVPEPVLPPDQRPFKCDKCTKTFMKKKNLQEHMFTHSDVKPFKCDLCGYRCRKGSNLKSHIMHVHRGQVPRKRGGQVQLLVGDANDASSLVDVKFEELGRREEETVTDSQETIVIESEKTGLISGDLDVRTRPPRKQRLKNDAASPSVN